MSAAVSAAASDDDQERRPAPDGDGPDGEARQPRPVQVEVPPVGQQLDHHQGSEQRDGQQLDQRPDPGRGRALAPAPGSPQA